MIELTHYKTALEIFLSSEFEDQDLWLHDWTSEVYKSKPNYTENGIHWGYTDALVEEVNRLPNKSGTRYAYIMDDTFKSRCQHNLTNSRFSKVKFKEIKQSVLKNMQKRLVNAEKEENFYQKNKKEGVEVQIHPVFEGQWYIVKYADNWADEMDIQGFMVIPEKELKQWKKRIPSRFTFGLGTNESIEYQSKKQFLDTVMIEKITTEKAMVLFELFSHKHARCLDWNGKYFNRIETHVVCNFGFIPTLHYFMDRE
jgi:hypothetical protein